VRERTVSAAVILAVAVAVFLLGQPWLSLGLALLGLLAAVEVFRLLRAAGLPVALVPGVLAAPAAVLGLAWLEPTPGAGAVFLATVVIVAALDAFRRSEPADGFRAWLGTTFGALYPALLAAPAGILALAPAIPEEAALAGVPDAGRVWLLVLVLTVWAFDTFAYLAGRVVGRGRFMNHISPNKTWSGVIGGCVAAVIVAGVLAWAAGQALAGGLVLGLLVAVAAQAGDLAESMLKRAAGAKDSGALIPGHGGILDRVDSFLFAGPVVLGYLLVVGR
jgi:phosphatidate cytidylyltransferase